MTLVMTFCLFVRTSVTEICEYYYQSISGLSYVLTTTFVKITINCPKINIATYFFPNTPLSFV